MIVVTVMKTRSAVDAETVIMVGATVATIERETPVNGTGGIEIRRRGGRDCWMRQELSRSVYIPVQFLTECLYVFSITRNFQRLR